MTILHEYLMQQAINYAACGTGRTAENPNVGCIIARDSQILAIAKTADGGRPHAEAIALKSLVGCGFSLDDATIYVTLEPCAHYGKTPPCAGAIINSGIKNVAIGCLDTDERVAGRGVAMLLASGLCVQVGVLEAAAKAHHLGFLRRIAGGLPKVTLKIATSYDEKITTGIVGDQWLTGVVARQYGQVLRSHHQAILSGIGTVAADNPILDCRLNGLEGYSPLRVVLDRHLRIDLKANIVQSARKIPTLIFSANAEKEKIGLLQQFGVEVEILPQNFELLEVLQKLSGRGINSVMIEGGQGITTSALNSGLVDELYWFIAPKIVGEKGINAVLGGSLQGFVADKRLVKTLKFNDDLMLNYDFSLNCN